MPFNIRIWFQDLLRPKLSTVRVSILENGVKKDITKYDNTKQKEIRDAVTTLWETPPKNLYEFQAEIFEKKHWFKTNEPTALYVCCYENENRTPFNIPNRYRSKFIGKTIPLNLAWSEKIEVRFHIPSS